MKSVIISPWSKKTPNGEHCAKNYPFWDEVVSILNSLQFHTIQIGIQGEQLIGCREVKFNLRQSELLELLKINKNWVSVDNFFQHFAHYYGFKGTVIFSKSDPNIFGYKENTNLLKSRAFLRKDQFLFWNNEKIDNNSFVSPNEVVNSVITLAG